MNVSFEENIPNWKIYNVLLVLKGTQEKKLVKVCLPLEESETAIVNDRSDPCAKTAELVDQERKKNDDYLENLRSNPNFPTRRRPEIPINNQINQSKIKNIKKFI